jgi:hypothetical protein
MDRPSRIPDVDLIYYNEDKSEEAWDKIYEASFSKEGLGARWSIKNQARMWQESRDPRYLRSADALLYAPDTVSSVGIRKRQDGTIVVFAPYGLSDLFSIRLSPTQLFLKHHGMSEFNGRIERKQWQAYWPKMTISATPIECRYNNPIELSPNMRLDLRSSSR